MSVQSDPKHLAYIGSLVRDSSDEWFTPLKYVEMAREVMGSIDLDPFSSDIANEGIKATRYFTADNSALTQPWSADRYRPNVFINPPYGKILASCMDAFHRERAAGHVGQAIVLLNNITETAWAQKLVAQADAICLVSGRIHFWNADNKASSHNTRGQIFYYFGYPTRQAEFVRVFSKIGVVFVKP